MIMQKINIDRIGRFPLSLIICVVGIVWQLVCKRIMVNAGSVNLIVKLISDCYVDKFYFVGKQTREN